jgi:excisionase family DNA binding protein
VEFMTTVQIADVLGVSEGRVKALIKSGELQAQAKGGVWEVDRRELASLAERIRQEPRNHRPDR